jgi:hypothetical protein
MKYVLIILMALISNHVLAEEFFDVYVQVTPSNIEGKETSPEKLFILVILSPLEGNEARDGATQNFVLAYGESDSKVFKNRHFPEREYKLVSHARKDEHGRRWVEVVVDVIDGSNSIFRFKNVITVQKNL